MKSRAAGPTAFVLAPTRELAIQILEEAKPFAEVIRSPLVSHLTVPLDLSHQVCSRARR